MQTVGQNEKKKQKLHKLTPDEIRLAKGGIQEKNPSFEGWITGRMAVVLYIRNCKPQIHPDPQSGKNGAQAGALSLFMLRSRKMQKNSGQKRRHLKKGCDRD
jgi:hypothetical protein